MCVPSSLSNAPSSAMADSTRNLTGLGGEASKHEEEEDDDYMGDLSKFIPPELTQTSKRKVVSKSPTLPYTKMCDFEFQSSECLVAGI